MGRSAPTFVVGRSRDARRWRWPIDITLVLTEACNLRCSYCYQPRFPDTRLSVHTGLAAVRSAIAHGAERIALTFFGGEPLLARDALFDILSDARRLGAEAHVPVTAKVSTNGLLLDGDTIEAAAASGLFISLSFDGVRGANDAHRRTPDGESSFDAAETALALLVSAGRPFAVYSVITPDNAQFLAESVRRLWDMGARILVNTLDYGADWRERDWQELRRQYARLGRFYEKRMRSKEFFHLEPFDSRIAQVTRPGEWSRCAPGVRQVLVAPDGVLYGCIEYFHRRLHPLGTAEEWVDAEAVRALAHEKAGCPESCGACGVAQRCNNACACVNLRGTGVPNRPPTTLCRGEREAVLASDKTAARLFRRKNPEFLVRNYCDRYHVLTAVENLLESMETER